MKVYRSDRLAYAALLLAAFLPRVLYLVAARPLFEGQFWALANGLLTTGQLGLDGEKTTALEPGYPLFLALTRIVVGNRMLLVQVVQCAVAALGAVFLFRLGRSLTGQWRVGAIAGALYAAYPLLIRHSADRTDAALMTTLLIAFASEFVAATTAAGVAAAGVCLGLAVLTRAMALPLIPLAAALQWQSRGWRGVAAVTLPALVLIAPFALRNYILSGGVLPTRSGLVLFISNSEYTPTLVPDYGPDLLEDYAASLIAPGAVRAEASSPMVDRAYDVIWTRLALTEMERHPARTAWLKIRNVLYFFSPRLVPYRETTDTTTIQLGTNGTFAVDHGRSRSVFDEIVYAASYTPVLALALMGLWQRRRDLRRDAILWCVVVTFVAAHAVYYPATRYRVPMEFVLLFYAAVTLDRWCGERALGASRIGIRPTPVKPLRAAVHDTVDVGRW